MINYMLLHLRSTSAVNAHTKQSTFDLDEKMTRHLLFGRLIRKLGRKHTETLVFTITAMFDPSFFENTFARFSEIPRSIVSVI